MSELFRPLTKQGYTSTPFSLTLSHSVTDFQCNTIHRLFVVLESRVSEISVMVKG